MIVDREWTDRDNRRLARRLKEARLAVDASLEDAVCDAGRGLDKAAVRQLATCAWVRAKQNVIVVGATGVGKTFLGAALAQAACRQGFRALCVRVPRLVQHPRSRAPTAPTAPSFSVSRASTFSFSTTC